MKSFLCVIVAGLLLASANSEKSSRAPLDFSFYITSQCRDTMNFVINQLYPVYQEFKDSINVEFIPWGKSRRETNGEITCQFGPTDCLANRLQSCALFTIGEDQDKQMEYINCEMTTLSSVTLDYTCVRQVDIEEEHVRMCYDSLLGDELQAMAEQQTGGITMVFVPTIVHNNVYDVDVQNAAYSDFRGFLCGVLQQENPNACQ